MQIKKLRSLIRESINEYIREIDNAANEASQQAKVNACEEAIRVRKERLERISENEDLKEMVDETKVKEIQNEIRALENYSKKSKKVLEKMKAKKDKKENPKKEEKEVTTDAKTKEAPVKEEDVTAEMEMKDEGMKEEALNESFLKMQKLAGVITESQYNLKKKALVENQLNEFDLDQFAFGDTPKDTPKASFEDKWNSVPPANKEVLKKSTGKEPILIMASSKGSNYLIAKGSDNKFYLYTFTQAANPGEPKGPFNSEEDAKKQVK